MRELRIAVIDDDYWKREHMAQELDSSSHIAVVHALDQDTAVQWSLAQWDEIDIAIVDVVDEMAPGEVGTDMFSGIQALERLKHIDVKTLAITPQALPSSGRRVLFRPHQPLDRPMHRCQSTRGYLSPMLARPVARMKGCGHSKPEGRTSCPGTR